MCLLVGFTVVGLVGPLVSPLDPIRFSSERLQHPDWAHPMGTDQFGRDVLIRAVYGTRISLQIAVIATGIAGLLGIALGVPCGYFGGKLDGVVMRLIDILQAFPSILLALALVAALGSNLQDAMVAVGLSSIPAYARMARAAVLATKPLAYVDAAVVVGCAPPRIVVHHILPNAVPPLIVLATTGVGVAISAAASLGFLGLGAQPPTPEWGAMLNDGRNFLRLAWWMGTFPGLAIMLMVLAANLVGDGLRDALDRRLWR